MAKTISPIATTVGIRDFRGGCAHVLIRVQPKGSFCKAVKTPSVMQFKGHEAANMSMASPGRSMQRGVPYSLSARK